MRSLGWFILCAVAIIVGAAVKAQATTTTVAFAQEQVCESGQILGWTTKSAKCRDYSICAVVNTDPIFDGVTPRFDPRTREALTAFFRNAQPMSYIIAGHTDAATDQIDALDVALARADVVAEVARKAGADVRKVLGYGDMRPRASNATPEGRAQNRRVEILCLK